MRSPTGGCVWIQDAYTISRLYPYSTPSVGGINYIRNSVKVTIDAYDGTTRFHLIDTKDPVAATFARVFPGLFEPLAAMPEDSAHPPALSAGHLLAAGRDVRHVPHDEPLDVLQP